MKSLRKFQIWNLEAEAKPSNLVEAFQIFGYRKPKIPVFVNVICGIRDF